MTTARSPRPAARPGPAGHTARPLSKAARKQAEQRRQARRRAVIGWTLAVLAAGVVATALIVTAHSDQRANQSSVISPAPGFGLPATSGQTVSLAAYRGRTVLLYFNEGVGCGACFYQMTDIEKHAADFAKAGVTVLPIVVDPIGQVRKELASYGVHTPYLIDADGSVSRAYGVLGKGMHAGLPGHGFVLIDKNGMRRWYGEYPSMNVSSAELLRQVAAHLRT